jgi:lipoate-protein ligase A
MLDAFADRSSSAEEILADPVAAKGSLRVRWWVASTPAVVLGLGLRHRLQEIVDVERCQAAGVEVLERRAGGGALLLDKTMLCGAVCVPRTSVADDVTESYRWLGDLLASRVRSLGVAGARRIEVDEARADVATLKSRDDPVARILLTTCYGALSPHEVAVGEAKLVGLAQIRRRDAALFQFGILLRDQSPLADYLQVPDEATRAELREALRQRTLGVEISLGGLQPNQLLEWPR